ncbi:MAG: aminoacyl-histidine dipeptidase [Actinomycetota bacterium]
MPRAINPPSPCGGIVLPYTAGMDAEASPLPEAYAGLLPSELWAHFAALNAIPRPPGHEQAALGYVQAVANAAGAPWSSDAAGNLVVRLAATAPSQPAPTVAVQAHLDMVCEVAPGVSHDWRHDPVRPRRVGDLIFARGTTLGADNGIGAAAALALITTPGLLHPPLELLFTVQEEVGLLGALALDGAMLRARMLVNLDSEDPDDLIIGSAGARDVNVVVPAPRQAAQDGQVSYSVRVGGLSGGHSGVQIHERRANAIKLLAQVLGEIRQAGCTLFLAALEGGTARNAIPREASALIAVAARQTDLFEQELAGARARAAGAWQEAEPGLVVEGTPAAPLQRLVAGVRSAAIHNALSALPHGVLAWSAAFPGVVQASANLSSASLGDDVVAIDTNVRSPEVADLDVFQRDVAALAASAGGWAEATGGYPAWPPAPQAELTLVAARVYEACYGHSPRVQVIHAGLECGVIAAKVPGMQAISFGPLIVSPHSPQEHVAAPTVASTWRFLVALLAELATGAAAGG